MMKKIRIFQKRNEHGFGMELPVAVTILFAMFALMIFTMSETRPYTQIETITEELNANYNLDLSEKSVTILLDNNSAKNDWTGEVHEVIINPSEAKEIYARNKNQTIILYVAETKKPLAAFLSNDDETNSESKKEEW